MIKKILISKIRKSRFSKIAAFWALGIINKDSYLAGGSLRTLLDSDEEVLDFDVFFADVNRPPLPEIPENLGTLEFDDNHNLITEPISIPAFDHPSRVAEVRQILEKEKFKLIFECEKGELFSYKKGDIKVQLVTVSFSDPETMVQSFDFGACRAAFDGEVFYYDPWFVRDVKRKILSCQFVEYPAATIKRIIKYSKKGYNVNNAIVDFMRLISGLPFDDEKLRLYVD